MSVGRLVPWTCWEEWREVGEWLLSADPGENRKGLDRVAAWRCRGRVPLGADITASFIETKLRDHNKGVVVADGPPYPSSSHMLRCHYSMSVIRMVNGIADSTQKGRLAASVAQLAAAAGLPRLLVDLRHEASHNELPSLGVLRVACDAALQWLQSSYWLGQQHHLTECQNKTVQLIKEYVGLCNSLHAKGRSADTIDNEEDTVEAADWAEGPSGQGVSNTGHQSLDVKQRRKSVLGDLKSAVPLGATHTLATHILDLKGVLDPPSDTCSALEFNQWQANMTALYSHWPALKGCLLSGALHRMRQTADCIQDITLDAQQEDVIGVLIEDMARCCRWVVLLVAENAATDNSENTKKTKRKKAKIESAAHGLSISVSPAQFQTVLVQIMRVHSLVATWAVQQSSQQSLHPSPDPSGHINGMPEDDIIPPSGPTAPTSEAALKLLSCLNDTLQRVAKCPLRKGKANKASKLALQLVHWCEAAWKLSSGVGEGGGSGAEGAAEGDVKDMDDHLHELTSQLQAAQQAQHSMMMHRKRAAMSDIPTAAMSHTPTAAVSDTPTAAMSDIPTAAMSDIPTALHTGTNGQTGVAHGGMGRQTNKRRRFVQVEHWKPCAIGNLPDEFNPNGRLPQLSLVAGQPLGSRREAVREAAMEVAVEGVNGVSSAQADDGVPSAVTMIAVQNLGDDVSTCRYDFFQQPLEDPEVPTWMMAA